MTTRRPNRPWAGALVVVCAVAVLAACSSPSGPASSSSGTPSAGSPSASSPTASVSPSTTASASTAASPSGSGSPTTDLADGRYPAYVTKVDAARRLLTVDVVQFFTGKAAATAAAGDHAGEVPPPNDYWIRNSSDRLRTLTVAAGAPVTVNVLSATESGSATKNTAITMTKLASYPSLVHHLFWVTVRHGVVSKLSEQFLP